VVDAGRPRVALVRPHEPLGCEGELVGTWGPGELTPGTQVGERRAIRAYVAGLVDRHRVGTRPVTMHGLVDRLRAGGQQAHGPRPGGRRGPDYLLAGRPGIPRRVEH